jgi:poly-beta-1,6-N-acetyl-D-glucosamine synthase
VIEITNWILCFLIVLLAAFYPLYLFFSKKRTHLPENLPATATPLLSIVIPCYNEENYIERKIHEILQACTGRYTFEIIVLSDGSSDETENILQKFADNPHIRIDIDHERKGKPYRLNRGVALARHEFLILSDARQHIAPDAVSTLVRHFTDPEVGAVTSRLVNGADTSIIRRMINRFKSLESLTGSTVGAYGAFYAIRKSCYRQIPEDLILDDLFIPVSVIAQGKRVLFEAESVIYDIDIERFYIGLRVARMMTGLVQFLKRHGDLVRRMPVRYQIYLFFQKYLKLILPLLLLLNFVLNIFLLHHPVFRILFYIECVVLAISIVAALFRRTNDIKLMYMLLFRYFSYFGHAQGSNTVKWKKAIK